MSDSSLSHLQHENEKLKHEVDNLQQQLHNYQKQILDLKRQLQPTSNTNKSSENKHDLKKQAASNTDIERNISKDDAKNALLAKFGSVSSPNVMEVAAQKQSNTASFKKYELMLKVGVDLSGVITQMNKDSLDSKLIDEFKLSHGWKDEDGDAPVAAPSVDLSAPKFSKYHRMKKLKINMKTITNKMKLDGFSQLEMDVFSGKVNATASPQNLDPQQQAQQMGLPKKPTIPKPVNQMKRVHWEPVKLQKIQSSIWNQVDHSWFDYDPIMFELNFQTRKRKEKMQTDALKGDVGKSNADDQQQDDGKTNEDERQPVTFVDAKRSQLVQIGLRSFNMTNEQLREVILTMDEHKIDVGHLSTLIDIVPTPEEQIEAEKASKDRDVKYFGVVERFFYSIYDIIELRPRLQKWLFKLTFMDRLSELKQQIDILERGKNIVLRSKTLREIFAIILAFGNHMNFGNKKGNAYGFRLDAFSLFPQIKTTDNSMTFPMFIWAFIKRQYPHLLKILQEFEPVQEASHINMEVIEKQYARLTHEMKDIRSMIARYKEEYFELIDLEDMFLNDMMSFIQTGEEQMKDLEHRMDDLREAEGQLLEYFAYDVPEENEQKEVSLNSILKDIDAFIEMLNSSKQKIKHLEKEERKKQQRMERKLRKKKRANTEHMSRNRFQDILDKSREKKKKEKAERKQRRKHRKHRHRDKHHRDGENDGNDNNNEKDGDEQENGNESQPQTEAAATDGNTAIATEKSDADSLKIETITLGDAVTKKSKSRKSGYFDRTKHSSFELFKRSHRTKEKKKNIRFKDQEPEQDKERETDQATQTATETEKQPETEQPAERQTETAHAQELKSSLKAPHRKDHARKVSHDDLSIEQYAKNQLLDDSDEDDDDDEDAAVGIPGLLKSKSLKTLFVAKTLSLPKQDQKRKTDQKETGKVDSSNVQRVRLDEDGKVHNVPTTSPMLELSTSDSIEAMKNEKTTPPTPDSEPSDEHDSNDYDYSAIPSKSNPSLQTLGRPRPSLLARISLTPSRSRRNSDPCTPGAAERRSTLISQAPLIALSMSYRRSSMEMASPVKSDLNVMSMESLDDDLMATVSDDEDMHDLEMRRKEQERKKKTGLSAKSKSKNTNTKKNGNNKNKNGKKKQVRIAASNKKKGNNKKKNQKQKKPQSTRAADDFSASFFSF